jgi:ribose transport system substrate-binding protein
MERLAGTREVLGEGFDLRMVSGLWTEESAEKAVLTFLRLRTNESFVPRVVASQNDAMAMGAHQAVQGLTDREKAQAWSRTTYLGCDGLPEGGQRLVREGKLGATVVTPSNAGPAVDLVAEALRTGRPAPAQVTLQPSSFPDLSSIRALPG